MLVTARCGTQAMGIAALQAACAVTQSRATGHGFRTGAVSSQTYLTQLFSFSSECMPHFRHQVHLRVNGRFTCSLLVWMAEMACETMHHHLVRVPCKLMDTCRPLPELML